MGDVEEVPAVTEPVLVEEESIAPQVEKEDVPIKSAGRGRRGAKTKDESKDETISKPAPRGRRGAKVVEPEVPVEEPVVEVVEVETPAAKAPAKRNIKAKPKTSEEPEPGASEEPVPTPKATK